MTLHEQQLRHDEFVRNGGKFTNADELALMHKDVVPLRLDRSCVDSVEEERPELGPIVGVRTIKTHFGTILLAPHPDKNGDWQLVAIDPDGECL